jgi:hypothetical protein
VTLRGMAGRLYESTFSGNGSTGAYGAWNFSAHPVDAVVINRAPARRARPLRPQGARANPPPPPTRARPVGTNDRPAPPALQWQGVYASFVERAAALYGAPAPAFFLAFGPMTAEYEPMVRNVTATLAAAGARAFALDLTLPHALTGCFGHPSAADNVEIAAKARPQIAAALGWA